jgi:hypothetical protein
MPELRHLRAFVTVAEQLSFTRAAELLHLTQQTVSRTVSELERELGVSLLERTTREVRLTAAGASLLRDGVEAVRAADAAFARAREIENRLARPRADRGLARDRAARPRRRRPRAAPARVGRVAGASRGPPRRPAPDAALARARPRADAGERRARRGLPSPAVARLRAALS